MAKAATIGGLWGRIKLVCACHPETQTEMTLQGSSHTLQYICPAQVKDEFGDDVPCKNHIFLKDYENMVDHIANVLYDADANDTVLDLTNYRWKAKNGTLEFQVLKYTEEEILISLVNKNKSI